MKRYSAILALLLVAASPSLAASLDLDSSDTLRSVLVKQQGKAVTVRLRDGGELTGQVKSVGEHTLLLVTLTGREFFDGVIDLNEINALIIRNRDR